MSFDTLRRNRAQNFQKLVEAVNKLNGPSDSSVDNSKFWSPTLDKAKNGYAIIRFLPAPEGEDTPFVRLFKHSFKGPTGKWYIENSLSTIGEKDPVGELNSQLWNSGSDKDKATARDQKRKLSYYSNILVVSDPANRENEGKVFLFKYGKKIFDKINDKMNPQFEDEEAINPFDMWDGANFKLRIREVEGWTNYDKSEFDSPSAISDDDEVLRNIYESLHSLSEIVDRKNFKSYEELSAKLASVLGTAQSAAQPRKVEEPQEEEWQPRQKTEAPKSQPAANAPADDEDDDFAFFKNLADSDD